MIQTFLQYRVTHKSLLNFEKELLEIETTGLPDSVHPTLLQVTKDAMKSVMKELREDMDEFERSFPQKTNPAKTSGAT